MKNTNLILASTSPNEWKLQGELTMMSLSEMWRSLEKARPVRSPWHVDFSEITQMDSAGVAFLLDCIRYAESLKLELHFLGLSNEVFELIEAQGVMSLIDPYLSKKDAA
jgi:ABC-type transporter Mla MlaB component